jgi:site-specific DNA recombinase
MTRAVIYCRVSSERQVKEGDGLGSQEQRCQQYAKNAGYRIIDVFREKGVSGGLFERPAMKEMLKCLEENDSHNVDDRIVVVFDDLKRFARDTEIHFGLKREIYGRNGRVESPNFRFEDTPEGKFVETVMTATAELERNQNKRQVIHKMKARLERGYWPFMPPIALKNIKDPINGKLLTKVEPHASIFKGAIEKYRDGILLTQDEVKQYLHREYKTVGLPNRPSLSTTVDILKNPLYAGYIEYPDWKVPFMKAKHEGFITLETYTAVQERLQGRSKPWQRRDYSADFPLRPHVLCASCGKPMTASWNKGRSARYPNYFCRIKGCKYNWKVVNKHKMEGAFEALLSTVKPADELIDLTREVLQEQWDTRFEKHIEYRAKVANDVSEVDAAIKSYLERIRKTSDEDLISAYEEEIKELKQKKKNGVKELVRQSYTSKEFGTASEKVFNTLKKPMDMWKSDEYNDKRTILFMYFEEELRYDYNLGFGTATLSTPLRLINTIKDDKKSSSTESVEMSGSEPESE